MFNNGLCRTPELASDVVEIPKKESQNADSRQDRPVFCGTPVQLVTISLTFSIKKFPTENKNSTNKFPSHLKRYMQPIDFIDFYDTSPRGGYKGRKK